MAAKRAAKAELRSRGGEDIGAEKLTDLATGLVCRDALAVLWSVKTAEAHVVRGMRKLAAAAATPKRNDGDRQSHESQRFGEEGSNGMVMLMVALYSERNEPERREDAGEEEREKCTMYSCPYRRKNGVLGG